MIQTVINLQRSVTDDFQGRFCAMQDYDTQLQRALNYEDYDLANEIRQRRQSVDEAMDRLKVWVPTSPILPYAARCCVLLVIAKSLTH